MYAFLVTSKNPLTIARDSRDCPRVPGMVPCTHHLLKLHLYSQRVLINTPSCLRHCTQKYYSSHSISMSGPQSRQRNGNKSSPVPRFLGATTALRKNFWSHHTLGRKEGHWTHGKKKRCHVHRCQVWKLLLHSDHAHLFPACPK